MTFTNFLFTIIIKLLLDFQLFWTNGSWEEILKIFSYIYTVKNSFPCCGPTWPPAAMNLTNLHCTMSESFHVNFSHSGPAVLEKIRLIDYLQFYVLLKNISLIWRRHHCRWRAAKFRPMLSAQGFWAGRDLYCATPAVTRDLDFSGLIRRTAPFSRLLRHMRGCGGSILTRILTGWD
jgi:hypothetical protein